MNHLLQRPSYFDYGSQQYKASESNNTTVNSKNSSLVTSNNVNTNMGKPSSMNMQNIQTNVNTIFKRSKKPQDYKINPDLIPRPKHLDEVYGSYVNSSLYQTSIDSIPPYVTSIHSVKEVENSSPRLIRSSILKLPLNPDLLNNSQLTFGLYCQPFAELDQRDTEIPQVAVNEDILRCTRCGSYINNKFLIQNNKQGKRIAICNCCNYELELNLTNPGVKNEYFSADLSHNIELNFPTVDFIAPKKFMSKQAFSPIYVIMIDISQLSIDLGFAAYILNSISSSLDYFHNKSQSSIILATFDSISVQFYYADNNGEIKIIVMGDLESPFSPFPREKLILNIENDIGKIEKIIEKIHNILACSTYPKEKNISCLGTAIAAGYDAISGIGGGRLIALSCSNCNKGYGSSKIRNSNTSFNTENEKELYNPQNDVLSKLASQSIESDKIVVDLFILNNHEIDLVNFSQIANLTGGSVNYYTIDNSTNLSLKYEQIHYDLNRIFTRPNYYNVAFKLRATEEIDIVEMLGSFGRRPGSALSLAGFDPDSSLSFLCRLKEKPQSNLLNFQLAIIFTDNFNKRFLRIVNYSVSTTTDLITMYKNLDVDVLTKITIQKSISMLQTIGFSAARKDLYNKLVNILHLYKQHNNQPSSELVLPEAIKYYPLYLSSFFKSPLLRNNKQSENINTSIGIINRMMREPVYSSIKYLYPKLYRVDDINFETQEIVERLNINSDISLKNIGGFREDTNRVELPYIHALTIARICFEGAYLIDDGRIIYLCIFNETNVNFIKEIFNMNSFEELVNAKIEALDENNENDLNIRLLNIVNQIRNNNNGVYQPLKIIYIVENGNTLPDEFISHLVEDAYKGEISYIDFLCDIYNNIQNKKNKN